MTREELASKLDGLQYCDSAIENLSEEARYHGLIYVFGSSDDLLEFRGEINDEIGAYEGCTVKLNDCGIVEKKCEDDDCPHDLKIWRDAKHWVKAEWCPESMDTSWLITASVSVVTFDIFDEDFLYCRGIVFSIHGLDRLPVEV